MIYYFYFFNKNKMSGQIDIQTLGLHTCYRSDQPCLECKIRDHDCQSKGLICCDREIKDHDCQRCQHFCWICDEPDHKKENCPIIQRKSEDEFKDVCDFCAWDHKTSEHECSLCLIAKHDEQSCPENHYYR